MNPIFSRINYYFRKIHSGNETLQPVDIYYWRNRIFNTTIILTLLLGLIFLVACFIIAINEQNYNLVVSSLSGYLLLLIIYYAKVVKFELKYNILIVLAYLYGAYILLFSIHMSTGLVFLFVSSVLTGILRNMKVTFTSLVVNAVTLVIAGIMSFGNISFQNTISSVHTVSTWTLTSLEFMVINTVIALSLSMLLKGLENSIKTENTVKKLLEIEHSRVLKAKEKAEEADKLKSSFLANMSHEIRTPMNGILGFAEYLKNNPTGKAESDEFLEIIVNNGKYLLHLINDIIDISKIEANQLKIKETQFNPDDLFDELFTFYHSHKNRTGKDHIALYLSKTHNIKNIQIIADRVRLKQILSNLIDNAIKFTEKGSVEFGYKVLNDGTFEFFVEDTGIGMTKEEQKIVFDRFTRAKSHMDKTIKGTGLGLSISKSLIELMGGTIEVSSLTGKGSVFSFRIPKNAFSKEQKLKLGRIKDTEKYNWADKSILLVEDNPDGLRYLLTVLEPTGANLEYATNGADAVRIVSKNNGINLILMDIQLPEMNGLQATKEILKLKRDLPIIAQTAFSFNEDRERSYEAGCVDYITKPIDRIQLLKTINKYI